MYTCIMYVRIHIHMKEKSRELAWLHSPEEIENACIINFVFVCVVFLTYYGWVLYSTLYVFTICFLHLLSSLHFFPLSYVMYMYVHTTHVHVHAHRMYKSLHVGESVSKETMKPVGEYVWHSVDISVVSPDRPILMRVHMFTHCLCWRVVCSFCMNMCKAHVDRQMREIY